jgi:hypothetical protein
MSVEQPYATSGEVRRLVEAFESATLSRGEWTHRAHLTVALWYASHFAPAEALGRVRAGILRLNASHGVPTTPTRGYHETITRFYMHVIARFVAEEGPWVDGAPGDGWEARANRLVERYGARELPRRFYSEPLLASTVAGAAWVEPDLQALP